MSSFFLLFLSFSDFVAIAIQVIPIHKMAMPFCESQTLTGFDF
ncbi:hypothetical protein [Pseudanabaena sp. UWO310]|nr:hypothetical protein [Pseudanabaena sp. UWO310]